MASWVVDLTQWSVQLTGGWTMTGTSAEKCSMSTLCHFHGSLPPYFACLRITKKQGRKGRQVIEQSESPRLGNIVGAVFLKRPPEESQPTGRLHREFFPF